ncbi:MAG: hypothetical protein ACP5JS_03185 [Fervidobacterium sp.]
MGELPNDIRSILEALARREISVDDAEKLILTIKSAEKHNNKKEKSIIGKEFTLNEQEEFDGDLEIVNGKASIFGILNGNLQIIFGELVLSGTIKGDVELVGSTITWNGGIIEGNLEMVGCNYKGEKPKVRGNITEINNFFINGILNTVKHLIIKPFMSGIKVEE